MVKVEMVHPLIVCETNVWKGNKISVPLSERQNIQDPRREVASTMERPEMRHVELADRTHSQRNMNLMDQHIITKIESMIGKTISLQSEERLKET